MPNKATTTAYASSFAEGQAAAAPGNATGAGGANLKKPFPTVPEGDRLNKGRLNGGTERNYNQNGLGKPFGAVKTPSAADR